jgi:kynurenine formamidase
MACLREQQQLSATDLLLHKGDMIFFRMGYTKQYQRLTSEAERELSMRMVPETCGIAQDERMLQFLWDHQVSLVGSDTPAWEKMPTVAGARFTYHEVLIAGWGCPIGEMLVLDELAEACSESRKWTFFLSSAPLHVEGGVASPANMIAIL